MIVTLIRDPRSPASGTFGELVIEGERFFTVERPWLENEPYSSCVPEGVYQVEMLPTTTNVPGSFKDRTWYLIGNTVGYDVGIRTRIAIHIANWPRNVKGCIGVGRGIDCDKANWMVTNSTLAMERLLDLLPEKFELVISSGDFASD